MTNPKPSEPIKMYSVDKEVMDYLIIKMREIFVKLSPVTQRKINSGQTSVEYSYIHCPPNAEDFVTYIEAFSQTKEAYLALMIVLIDCFFSVLERNVTNYDLCSNYLEQFVLVTAIFDLSGLEHQV